ncbi:hypothetical protein BDB00DRAFT_869160 [Zychaea mexicana]|uniref:uncharacterized protein n=1 Tax=Zychaea mexicana TaxID=64656 RepID=UPI0022FEA3BB|nr:uncharacterized protein BDB00DRAFT_869160 [Zychaea mexicana]KAI9496575.1 hypothetical protein BDB00DRAFT_869160 [Zychaea mexicana]
MTCSWQLESWGWSEDLNMDKVVRCTLIARFPKEATGKASKLGSVVEYSNVRPVRALSLFIERTQPFRQPLPVIHKQFCADITNDTWRLPVSATTVANWMEQTMAAAGGDTTAVHKAHYIRTAASTYAVLAGHPVDEVKAHANWSLASATFHTYYFRPYTQHARGTRLAHMLFSSATEDVPTSEDEWKQQRLC